MIGLAAAALLLGEPGPAAGVAPPPAPLAEATTEGPVLRAGTPVRLRTLERLSSKTATQGMRFALEAIEPVLVDGLVVIPRGARGAGEVARVIEKGMFGKSGKLRIRALFVEAGGHRIRLDGEALDRGTPGTAPVLLAAPLVGISAGWFSGTSAVIESGSEFEGYVARDLPLIPAPSG